LHLDGKCRISQDFERRERRSGQGQRQASDGCDHDLYRANGYEIVDTYYDAAVSGADPVTDRSGFTEMLRRLATNGAKTIIVESPDRFARDLMVLLVGHDLLKTQGITLIPTTALTTSHTHPRLVW
jgi:DNA invertase Pin-like site-specific DNA recombinase